MEQIHIIDPVAANFWEKLGVSDDRFQELKNLVATDFFNELGETLSDAIDNKIEYGDAGHIRPFVPLIASKYAGNLAEFSVIQSFMERKLIGLLSRPHLIRSIVLAYRDGDLEEVVKAFIQTERRGK